MIAPTPLHPLHAAQDRAAFARRSLLLHLVNARDVAGLELLAALTEATSDLCVQAVQDAFVLGASKLGHADPREARRVFDAGVAMAVRR